MHERILLSADTPCDIGPEITERYDVSLFPLHIILEDNTYTDGVDITNDAIYRAWWDRRVLPKTAAINPDEYIEYFRPYVEDGYDIVHISLGSGISCTHQNAVIAANMLDGHVHVIDSRSLSTGTGLLVCEAGERIRSGMSAEHIADEVTALVPTVSASFVLDTLEFMHAGGRCSNFTQLSANLMQIKPNINVVPASGGAMVVGKKYIGKFGRSLKKYIDDQLSGRTDIVLDRAFITYSTCDESILEDVKAQVLSLQPFREVFLTKASCTIGAHCGPSTLGVLFRTKAAE